MDKVNFKTKVKGVFLEIAGRTPDTINVLHLLSRPAPDEQSYE